MRFLPLMSLCGCWILSEGDLEDHDRLVQPDTDTPAPTDVPPDDTGGDVDTDVPFEGIACDPRVFVSELEVEVRASTTLVTSASMHSATDLVLATADGWVSLLPRSGDGFGARFDLQLPGAACPTALVTVARESRGDYVAVLDPCGRSIVVLGPDGSGQLAVRQTLPLDAAPEAVVPGFFDAGGTVDLAVLLEGGELRHFGLDLGESFVEGPTDRIPALSSPLLTAGDLDNDGIDDLALASAGQVLLFSGVDAGQLAELAPTRDVTGAQIADVNRDGRADVVVTLDDGTVETFLQGEAGSFGDAAKTDAGGIGTVTAMFEAGCTSAVSVDPSGDAVLFLRGLGDGTFDPATPLGVEDPDAVVVGQFVHTEDDQLDLAVLSTDRRLVEIFRGGAL